MYFVRINTPHLSEYNKDSCERKLTLQNILEALISMKNGKKIPGNDSLTKEFYVCFFGELGTFVLKSPLLFSFW